jgi:hypothetical protein
VAYELRESGARAFVLLRPELGLVVDATESMVPIIDAAELHALAAVDWAFGKPDPAVPLSAETQPTEKNRLSWPSGRGGTGKAQGPLL